MTGLKRLLSSKGISIGISVVSLVVAFISLALSLENNRRSSEQFLSSMTATLKANYDQTTEMLLLEPTETAKSLSWGTWFLPAAFRLEPIIFKAPESTIAFAPVAESAGVVLNGELARIRRIYPGFPQRMQGPVEFAVPVFSELRTTTGGSLVQSTTAYVLVMECIPAERNPKYHCGFKDLAHNGRLEVETPGFFHWPWSSRKEIAEKGRRLREERLRALLDEHWEELRPSMAWPSQADWTY